MRLALKSQSGFTAIIATLMLLNMIVIGALSVSTVMTMQTRQRMTLAEVNGLQNVAGSALIVMESALIRRLWNPPPDAECFMKLDTSVSGSTQTGASWTVRAVFDPDTRIYSLESTATKGGRSATVIKKIRTTDLGENLLVVRRAEGISGASGIQTTEMVLRGGRDPKRPAALIAGDRKVILGGRTYLAPYSHGNLVQSGFSSDCPSCTDYRDYNLIIQGSRLNFSGGLAYQREPFSEPDVGVITPPGVFPENYRAYEPSASEFTFSNLLNGWVSGFPNLYDSNRSPRYRLPRKTGRAVFFANQTQAESFANSLRTGTTPVLPREEILQKTFPIALGGAGTSGVRSVPYLATVDDGNYWKAQDQWFQASYPYLTGYMGMAPFQSRTNGTPKQVTLNCFAPPPAYGCSDSERFAKGFENWVRDAGLTGVVSTGDITQDQLVDIPLLSRDALDSLREDAVQCGRVVTPSNTYQDCPIWSEEFVQQLLRSDTVATAPLGTLPDASLFSLLSSNCSQVSRLDFNSIGFNNFDASKYQDPSYQKRSLRRVIYSETEVEFAQTSDTGLWSSLTDSSIRQNIPIWYVNPKRKTTTLKGFQANKNPPSAAEPVRSVSFNKDVSGAGTPRAPLNLVFVVISPVHLLSEQYVPLDSARFVERFSVTRRSGYSWNSSILPSQVYSMLSPKIYMQLDSDRWEDDAFAFGLRDFEVNNLAMITNSRYSDSQPLDVLSLVEGGQPTPPNVSFQPGLRATDSAGNILTIPSRTISGGRRGVFSEYLVLRGFWSLPFSFANQSLFYECGFQTGVTASNVFFAPNQETPSSSATVSAVNYASVYANYTETAPSSGRNAGHPAANSKFFAESGGNRLLRYSFVPDVFRKQRFEFGLSDERLTRSQIRYSGIVYKIPFEFIEGLDGVLHVPMTLVGGDIRNRYHRPAVSSGGEPCENLAGVAGLSFSGLIPLNLGDSEFVMESPGSPALRNLGNIGGNSLPIQAHVGGP